jgi:hypothetical protein
MGSWGQLSERQLLLLQRIGGGDDLSGPDGVSQRTSARSLQSRQLVKISRRDKVWRAQITETGRFYLKHGHRPSAADQGGVSPNVDVATVESDEPSPRPTAKRSTPVRNGGRSAATSVVEMARALIQKLQQEGGTLTIEDPDEETRAAHRRTIHAAKQHNLVPEGLHLKHTGRARGDLIIRLTGANAPDETDWNRIRLNTRRVTSSPSLVIEALEKDPAGLQVTEALVPRALDFVRALAEQARQRGHRLGVNTETRHPRLYLQLGQTRRSVTLREEYDEVKHVPTQKELRELRRSPWHRIPETDRVPSGRLCLEINRAGHGQADKWADDKRATLEKRLPRIIREIEAGIEADDEARRARERAHQEYLAEQRRREEEQHRQWQEALDQARPQAVEALRRKLFRSAFDDWAAASEIRAFCDALEGAGDNTDEDSVSAGNRARWVAWGRAEADRIDPTHGGIGLAGTAFEIKPRPDDLRPFIGDWSPHQPRREYRYERDERKADTSYLADDTWHHGMRGRPAWWRNR